MIEHDVVKLDHADPAIAVAICELMRASYAIEAALLGVRDFAPLRRTAENIATTDARFLGIWRDRHLVAAAELETPSGSPVHIGSLVVHPSEFRRGYARSLLRQIIAGNGSGGITVSTAALNEPALRLYAAHGFREQRRWATDGIALVTLLRPGAENGGVSKAPSSSRR